MKKSDAKFTYTQLPDEIKLQVAQYFSVHDLKYVTQVSKTWRSYYLDNFVWKRYWQSYQKFVKREYGINWPSSEGHQLGTILPRYHILTHISKLQKKLPSFFFQSLIPNTPQYIACWYANLTCGENELKHISYLELLNLAASAGNFILVRWLIGKKAIVPTDQTLDKAIFSGNLALVEWLVDDAYLTPHDFTIRFAASTGNIALVWWLISEKDLFLPLDTLTYAAVSGNLALAQWIYEINPETHVDIRAFLKAIYSGNLALVRWLNEEFDPLNLGFTSPQLNYSGVASNLALVQWLVKFCKLRLDKKLIIRAAESGDILLVKWLLKQLGDNAIDSYSLLCFSARSGHLPIVKWVMRFNLLTYDDEILGNTAISGNHALLKRLLNLTLIPPNQKTLYGAAGSGNFTLVKWLIQQKHITPNADTLNNAAYFGSFDIVRWLVEIKCLKPDVNTLSSAIHSCNVDLIVWLVLDKHIIPNAHTLERSSLCHPAINEWLRYKKNFPESSNPKKISTISPLKILINPTISQSDVTTEPARKRQRFDY